jgi:nitrogen fixation/metabolism regulation signal transduction histidine kinase
MKLPDENQGCPPTVPAGHEAEWRDWAEQLAHEIKNSLTPVRLSAERLLRRYHHDPEHLHEIFEPSMNAIIAGTDNLAALLTDFQTLARPVETSDTSAALSVILDECVSIFGTAYPGVRFHIGAAVRDLTVAIDARHLRQILNNLITNAIDAMNAQGTIEITARPVGIDGLFAKISVTDSGGGIGDEAKDHIFTPHWTGKPAGTGLGLSIVEHIAHGYGGSVSFTSVTGTGTTFDLLLPRKNSR